MTTLALDTVTRADLFDQCALLPDASVDMILCDLPYGTTACSWDTVIPFEPMWAAFKRIVKPKGAIVLTASQPFTSALVMSNVEMFKYAWVWNKVRPVGFLNAKVRPMMQHEDIAVFCSESPDYYPQMIPMKRSMPRRSASSRSETNGAIELREIGGEYTENYPRSILEYSGVDNSERYHPTQKPVALFAYLVRTYTREGDVVFDPTCGSGTTALAARQEGRHYIVGDYDQHWCEVTLDRLRMPFEKKHVKADDTVDFGLFALPAEDGDDGT